MPSRRFAAKYGAIRFLSCPGRAETVSKFRAVSGNAWRTPSPSPPKSAKVKLRTGNLTGNFSDSGPFGRFLCPIDQINQRLAPQFPEHGNSQGGVSPKCHRFVEFA